MEKVEFNKGQFKIVPEADKVTGTKQAMSILRDARRGIKSDILQVIYFLAILLDIEPNDFDDDDELIMMNATAYCHPDDKFDKDIGVRVCDAKLDLRNHYKMVREYHRMYKLLEATGEKIVELFNEHKEKAEAIEKDMVKMYGRLEV